MYGDWNKEENRSFENKKNMAIDYAEDGNWKKLIKQNVIVDFKPIVDRRETLFLEKIPPPSLHFKPGQSMFWWLSMQPLGVKAFAEKINIVTIMGPIMRR